MDKQPRSHLLLSRPLEIREPAVTIAHWVKTDGRLGGVWKPAHGESKQATDAAELCGHRICSGQVSGAGTRRTSYERGSSGGGRREIQKSALAAQGGHGSGAATLPWLCRPSLSPPPAPPSTCHPLSSMHAPRRRRRPLPRGSTSY